MHTIRMAVGAALLGGCLLCAPSGVLAENTPGVFNPFVHGMDLPIAHKPKGENEEILKANGGVPQSLAMEVQYRPLWKEELYPVIFGDRNAKHEILVVINFANPKSKDVWAAVNAALPSLNPRQAKVVLFAANTEMYGNDLTGLVIWAAHNRPGQAPAVLSWCLDRWNTVKNAQRKQGKVRPFHKEYDGIATSSDFPMVFDGMGKMNPPVSPEKEGEVVDYVYEAGNVNSFQARIVADYYSEGKLPVVICDGNVLDRPSSGAILSAVK